MYKIIIFPLLLSDLLIGDSQKNYYIILTIFTCTIINSLTVTHLHIISPFFQTVFILANSHLKA